MRNAIAISILTLSISALTACGSAEKKQAAPAAPQTKALPDSVDAAVSSDYRTPENRARDVYRHPRETLTFFGLKPEMTVVEIWPGAGWYAEILAPLLTSNGRYIAAVPASTVAPDAAKKFADWRAAHPDVAAKITLTDFVPPFDKELAPAGTVDMVLTFRNVHNWMSNKAESKAFKSFFKALKPGGTLGVVEHRANPKSKTDPMAKSGYVKERDVIRLAERAGFKLVEKSEINANPKDTKNHPSGVWTLPPTYKLGDKDHEKYAAIGESDRMTLKFMKPAK